nr:MAG TPA: hypothetical protein [Caudoviricetes sp.]
MFNFYFFVLLSILGDGFVINIRIHKPLTLSFLILP